MGRLEGADGDVSPEALTWIRLNRALPMTTLGKSDERWSARVLPAVTHVAYDAAQNAALVTVTTAGAPDQKLDLFYQYLPRDGSDAKWKFWQLAVQPGPGSSIAFAFPIPQSEIPNPQFLLFQVSPHRDTDSDGVSDEDERRAGTDTLRPDNPAVKFNVFTPLR